MKSALAKPLADQELGVLLWSMGKTIRSMSDCLARLYMNTVLARRDALLEFASSRIPPECLPRIRSLPIDRTAIFGPQVAGTVGQANAKAVTDQFLALANSRPPSGGKQARQQPKKKLPPPPRRQSPAKRRSDHSSEFKKPKFSKKGAPKGQSKGAGHPQ